ncbi:PREDICTED: probable ATP-dependent RNA helicase DDX60-like [Nanorana parkeri]|uniref:probable ATP-dependent RNA helicase DDX60-like n=1 Tax=Nanorana parkeri TaxID=125878 RepID=UPI0008549614|nr:PREDICTED: probable ATP-dependent RNA helicase DDX60-like [Nanorana parkeri]
MKKPITFSDVVVKNLTQQLLKSTFVSLLNDYVESEFFVIDGDSLLITCAMNSSLSPGESLHLFFLVEQFLFNLTSRQGRYVIVFFEDFKHFFFPYPLLRCWRTQLILHLQKNTNIDVYTFSSFLCEEWKTFLKNQAPYFFMVSDEGLDKHQTLFLNMLLLHALGNQIDVVLTDAQESDHLRVYGYYMKSNILIKKFVQENAIKFEETLQEKITAFQKHTESDQSSLLQEIAGEKQWRLQSVRPSRCSQVFTGMKDIRRRRGALPHCYSGGRCSEWDSLGSRRPPTLGPTWSSAHSSDAPSLSLPRGPLHGTLKAIKNGNFSNNFKAFGPEIAVQQYISLLSTIMKENCDVRFATCVFSCSLALNIHARTENSQHQNDNDPRLTLEEAADLCRIQCLSVAMRIILPLCQRAKLRRIKGKWNRDSLVFLRLQKSCDHMALDLMREHCKKTEINWTHVSDISDDLLLKNIAYYCEKEYNADLKLELGEQINEMYKHLWSSILKLFPQGEHFLSYELRTTVKPFLTPESSVNMEDEEILPTGLLPMRSDIIEEFAGDAMKELPILNSDDPVFSSLLRKETCDELRRWHLGRPLSDDYDRTKNNQQDLLKDKKALRGYQKYQAYNYRYGQTLGVKKLKKIIVQNDQPEEKKSAYKAPATKKKPLVKKKDQIIEENIRKSKAVEENKEQQQWKTLTSSLKKGLRENFCSGISQLEKSINFLQTCTVRYQAQMEALTMCYEIWLQHCKTVSEGQRDMNIAVQIMKIIQSIMANHKDMLQRADKDKIAAYLSLLGFENLSCSLKGSEVQSTEDKKKGYGVGVASARFQMKYMGPYLMRDERKDRDPRVQHFIPDTWQRELLDVVDNYESAVIVAPTSSGKTYASYYCMEKVLKQSNESVVVYVAPTKALINQVVATVTSQFNKDLPSGMTLCGVFIRDYRYDALNCQVLVTIPQCLEILLLSPHRQDWVKKIKYVIFDEVHCMGGEIGAEVWEHLLVMIRCPFLALSATISNPEHLTEWLRSVKKYWQQNDERESSLVTNPPQKERQNKPLKPEKKSYRVRLVCYDRRYNDLETNICSVENSKVTFDHYHPFAALTIDHVKNYGIPKDLTCSPRECIQLYDTMVKVRPTCANMKTLDPKENIHLKDNILITKDDVRKYQEALKSELVDWIEQGHCAQVSEVLETLKPNEPTEELDTKEYFPQLVEELNKICKLPALFFAFNKSMVEGLAERLYCHLRDLQKTKQTPQDEKEISKLQDKAAKLEKTIQINSRNQESQVLKQANYNSLMQKIKKLQEIPPDCTYADEKSVDNKVRQHKIEYSSHTRFKKLIPLSKRGIGYHHEAVDTRGRNFLEMLFRMGYVRVVTATGSLSLGINMPCKSVVFLHDSIFLDALNYRQMIGRAGRRGLDLEGSVYFFNIPVPKVKKLMKSNVPELRGQFPLSISLVLRLMLLAAKADGKEDAKAKVLSVLKHSLMTFKHQTEAQMLKLYCIFSLQFLLSKEYLDQDFHPTEFTGLVTQLHDHEPSNFVFVSFLEKGLFHQLCKPLPGDTTKFPDTVMELLVLILANLFARSYLAPSRRSPEDAFNQSKVCLEELPKDFADAVKEYNRNVATIFGHCILTASKLVDMDKEYQLPLAQISFSGKECMDSGLVDHLMSNSEGRSGISPFACLSGNTDHDLMKMTNVSSLMLQTAQIPEKYIPLYHLTFKDICGRKIFLNSYALDFYKHGSLGPLKTNNGLDKGDAYDKLKDFTHTIASISVSMKELCEDENDPVVLAFAQLHTIYSEKFSAV